MQEKPIFNLKVDKTDSNGYKIQWKRADIPTPVVLTKAMNFIAEKFKKNDDDHE